MSRWLGLEGRIAFVTGAAGGIGAALVKSMLEEGVRVVATDIAAPPSMNGVWTAPLDVA
ncbi:MAG: SDR family NAD(P)-dependent oxidoreductase, partial [Pseudomonadota bacterium]|nr:SDR family NAD(P)-dependent oxidoreductase [Pseudomonadota bacterium]